MNDDPSLGRQKWQTFLTQELPPVIDAEFNTNGVQSISAISMTATSVLNLAIAAPGLYKGVRCIQRMRRDEHTSRPVLHRTGCGHARRR